MESELKKINTVFDNIMLDANILKLNMKIFDIKLDIIDKKLQQVELLEMIELKKLQKIELLNNNK